MSQAQEASEARLAEAHAALLRSRDLQFDFEATPPPARPPLWLAQLLELLGPVLQVVFWAGLAAVAALLLYLMVRSLIMGRTAGARRTEAAATAETWRPDRAAAAALLSEIDALAAEGRYEAAVHLLLTRSIADIAAHRPEAARPALTSRDIAGHPALPARARPLFARIAATAERSVFGGRTVAQAEFAACRDDYERFALREVWT